MFAPLAESLKNLRPIDWAGSIVRRLTRADRFLLGALVALALLGAQGVPWGRYDCYNLDRMAFQSVLIRGLPPLHPGRFVKPPLYSYITHFLIKIPVQTAVNAMFWVPKSERWLLYLQGRQVAARMLHIAFFAGLVTIVFLISREHFGLGGARLAAWVLATSAGFLPYAIFLTTDMPLLFFMALAFFFATRILKNPLSPGISITAGLLAGLACAAKYNGLAVAAALPFFHLVAMRGNLLACLKNPAAWLCGLAVPAGFLLGNPYALLDFPTFWADFLYNYKVTPVYNSGELVSGYAIFFRSFLQIFGIPGCALVAIGLLLAPARLRERAALPIFFGALIVFSLYAWKIGAFPREEARFALPSAPFLLLCATPGLSLLMSGGILRFLVPLAVIPYNLVCGFWIGEMFRCDPRDAALDFAIVALPNGAKVEWSESSPKIRFLSGKNLHIERMPGGLERDARFHGQFADDAEIQDDLKKYSSGKAASWFSHEERANRSPDFIFWNRIDVEEIVRPFREALDSPDSPYIQIFHQSSPPLPMWVYPQSTEFLRNEQTIWIKRPQPFSFSDDQPATQSPESRENSPYTNQ